MTGCEHAAPLWCSMCVDRAMKIYGARVRDKIGHARFMAAGWRRKYQDESTRLLEEQVSTDGIVVRAVNGYMQNLEEQERDAMAMGGLFGLASFGHAVYFGVMSRMVHDFTTAMVVLMSNPTDIAIRDVLRAGHDLTQLMLKLA